MRHVLIVDSDSRFLGAVAQEVARLGYEVSTAASTASALAILSSREVAVQLMG